MRIETILNNLEVLDLFPEDIVTRNRKLKKNKTSKITTTIMDTIKLFKKTFPPSTTENGIKTMAALFPDKARPS